MIFSYLFQPDKSKLSPAGRAFIAWLEILIVSIPTSAAVAGLDYLNTHSGDWRGFVQFMLYSVIIATLKAFTTLGVSMKNTDATLPPLPQAMQPQAVPQPVVIQAPPPQIIHVPVATPAAQSTPIPEQPTAQFKAPQPAVSLATTNQVQTIPVTEMSTQTMPTLPPLPNGRDWTGLEQMP